MEFSCVYNLKSITIWKSSLHDQSRGRSITSRGKVNHQSREGQSPVEGRSITSRGEGQSPVEGRSIIKFDSRCWCFCIFLFSTVLFFFHMESPFAIEKKWNVNIYIVFRNLYLCYPHTKTDFICLIICNDMQDMF
jgi:hypothetical protein